MRLFLLIISLLSWLHAQDLDALLKRLETQSKHENALYKEREEKFLEKKSEQKQLLEQAQADLKAAHAKTASLQKAFDANEVVIEAHQKELDNRIGNLGEIFGVVRQNAGELSGVIRSSLVSAQYPNRTSFLDEMAKSKKLPDSKALETLWLETLNEMLESGKNVTFDAKVIKPDGTLASSKVTRIGLFSAMSEGKFLRYEGNLIELPRQPHERYVKLTQGITQATFGHIAPIDPTRGAILELMMEKPTLQERVQQGGLVGYVILILGLVGLLIAVAKFVYIMIVASRVHAQVRAFDTPHSDNPLGRVLQAFHENVKESIEIIESRLDEAILKELPSISAGEPVIKLLAAIAPLLGLLGTVVGMIETFQAITLFGTGDPKLMAGGISQALVTTMLGLLVAVPLLFAHAIVKSRSKRIIEILSQQSAGLIAKRMEHTGE